MSYDPEVKESKSMPLYFDRAVYISYLKKAAKIYRCELYITKIRIRSCRSDMTNEA